MTNIASIITEFNQKRMYYVPDSRTQDHKIGSLAERNRSNGQRIKIPKYF